MQNPFVYGEVVSASTFVNRVVELDRLVGDLTAGQKIFLISPRRYGKSSLIRQALTSLGRSGTLTVEVTVSSFSSYVAFLEGYARALMAAETKWDRARSWLRDAVRSARAEVRYVPDPTLTTPGSGSFSVSFPTVRSDRDVSRLAQEVFALPARLAAARKRPVVVALDEFQAIGEFNGGSVEHAMRAAVQHQRDVGYVFAGSEPSLMERMLTPKRPFYKAGPVMRLEKIPADEFADVHRGAIHQVGHSSGTWTRTRDRRSRWQSALRRSAPRARNVGLGAGWLPKEGHARRSPSGAEAAARRAGHDVRGVMAASHFAAACRASLRRAGGRT